MPEMHDIRSKERALTYKATTRLDLDIVRGVGTFTARTRPVMD